MIRLRLLGTIDLTGPDDSALGSVLTQPKRTALLAYLAVATPRGYHRRDTLLALFWPELDASHARGALSKAVHGLRRALGDGVLVGRGDEELVLDSARFWCDASAFEEALADRRLADGLELYRGHLLEGFHLVGVPEFQLWLDRERERLGRRAAAAAESLATRAEHAGDLAAAGGWALRWCELTPHDEVALRTRLTILDRIGDRAGAVGAYETFAERLREDLELEPAPETQALVREIRNRSAPTPAVTRSQVNGQSVYGHPGSTGTTYHAGAQEPESAAGPATLPVAQDAEGEPGRVRAERVERSLQPALGEAPAERPPSRRVVRLVAASAAVAAMLGATWLGVGRRGEAGGSARRDALPRLAVLPFENLGADDHHYFADGISDEIRVKLAGLRGLAVISRQSTMRYKAVEKSAQQIGKELGVQYYLAGTIRRQRLQDGSSRVRVAPQLVRTTDDSQLWAAVFDEPLSDVFEVQSTIAERVARALDVALLGRERLAMAARPTENLTAYEYFLRGNAHFRQGFPVTPALRDAVAMYEKAVESDPNFALAHARLSMAHGGLRWGGHDRSPERLAEQEAAARRALHLAPGLPEAHAALAVYYYWGRLDYERALRELAPALKAQPNNAEWVYIFAGILRRKGRLEEAAARFATASDLDPLAWSPALEAGMTYLYLRRYDEAERYLGRFAALQRITLVPAYLRLMRGDGAAETRASLEREAGPDSVTSVIALAAHGSAYPGLGRVIVRSLCGDCRAALGRVRRYPPAQYHLGKALLYSRLGEPQLARAHYDSAARAITAAGADAAPGLLAIAYAGLGKKRDAVASAKRAVALTPVARDAWTGVFVIVDLAEVHALAGDYDAAMDRLQWLLSVPSPLSLGVLRSDPLWDPIRSDPRFQRLLAGRQP